MTMQDDLLEFANNEDWEILTERGWENFKGVAKYNKKEIIRIILEGNLTIDVSLLHGFVDEFNNVVYAKDSLGARIKTKTGPRKVVDIKQQGYSEVYDVVDVAGGHTYLTNNIVSHNTHLVDEFWKSVFPIISSSKKSKVFICSTANGTENLFYKLYKGAEEETNGWAYDKIMWDEVPGRDEVWAAQTRQAIGSADAWAQEFCSCSEDTLVDIEGQGDMQLIDVFNEMEDNKTQEIELHKYVQTK